MICKDHIPRTINSVLVMYCSVGRQSLNRNLLATPATPISCSQNGCGGWGGSFRRSCFFFPPGTIKSSQLWTLEDNPPRITRFFLHFESYLLILARGSRFDLSSFICHLYICFSEAKSQQPIHCSNIQV